MNTETKALLVSVIIAIIIVGGLIVIVDEVEHQREKAYFEGQFDALNKDIRIKQDQNGCWDWYRNPWDNNRSISYTPTLKCSEAK